MNPDGTEPAARGMRTEGRESEEATLSVIVTAGGRRQFLPDALASIHASGGAPFELIVATDFHDDGLEREVRRRGGTWLVSDQVHLGSKTADGVRAARGSVVAFLDDDDLFHPRRVDEIRAAFRADPDLGFFHSAQVTFPDGERPSFPALASMRDAIRIPPGRRLNPDCERVWAMGAGYNGSSIAMRRALLEPHLDELAKMQIGIPPYFFYRAWCSSSAILMDPRALTAVRLHSANTTPNRLQGRRERFSRLASIAGDLSRDSAAILSFLPPRVWDVPLRQMTSMAEILGAVEDDGVPARRVAGAGLELLRRRRTWLPRWTLLSLALARVGSRRGARALYDLLTIQGP